LALGNLRILRLPGCRQKTDKGRKKLWWRMVDFRTKAETNFSVH
jgi:hypothetical protein